MTIDIPTTIKLASFAGAGLCIGFGAIGAALGEGYTAGLANQGLSQKPEQSGNILKNMLVGQAIAESAAIFALVVAILLLFLETSMTSVIKASSLVGAGLCMGLGAIGSGIGSGFPGGHCCLGLARQPAVSARLTTNMLIGSAVCQTPAIFAMVVALMLMFMDFSNTPLYPGWAALLGAGLCTGLAAIGSGAGGGVAAGKSCEGIARNPEMLGPVTTIMLVGQAISQTPAIFAMVVSLMLMFLDLSNMPPFPAWAALLGAGISTGFAAIGSGAGGGLTASAGCEGVSRHPETFGQVTTTMLIGQAVAQTPAIFGLLISFVLMFKFFPGSTAITAAMALLGAGICMGLGGLGPGLGNGLTAQGAVRWVAKNEEAAGTLTRTMLVGQAVSQSTAIYAMVVSLVLIFVV